MSAVLPVIAQAPGLNPGGWVMLVGCIGLVLSLCAFCFWKILTDCGISEIVAEGEIFDPKVHEAVMQEYSPDAEDGKILEVFQSGYIYKERVLRPTRVKIAKKGEPPQEAKPAAPADSAASPKAPVADTEAVVSPPTGASAESEPDPASQESARAAASGSRASPLLSTSEGREAAPMGGDIHPADETYETEELGPPISGNPLLDEPEEKPHA